MNLKSRWKFVIQRISITNALRFWQTSPLAVSTYSFGTQFVKSALFCVHPKGAVAFCDSSLLEKGSFINVGVLRPFDFAQGDGVGANCVRPSSRATSRDLMHQSTPTFDKESGKTRGCILRPPQRSCRILRQLLILYLIGEPVSRVLSFKTIIYLRRASLHGSSHLLERCRAGLAFHSGVAPGGVYIKSPSPGPGWALTSPFHPYLQKQAVYFCCTFLRVASTRGYLAPCPMELGLSSYTGLLLVSATVRFTKCILSEAAEKNLRVGIIVDP